MAWVDVVALRPIEKKKALRRKFTDSKRCWYCGIALTVDVMSKDHIIPRCRGGVDLPANIILSCKHCNSRKSDLLPEEFCKKLGGGLFFGQTELGLRNYGMFIK